MGINDLTALSLSSTLNQAASACKSLSLEGMKNGGGGSNFGKEKPSSRLGEYFALEIQRRFEDCVIKDDIEAKKEKKEKDKKRQRKKEYSKKNEGLLMELARDAFMSFLRSYSTKKEAAVRSIFSARALHVGHVARSFALKEPPKSLVSKHRQHKKEQEQENMDAEANKPKSLAFNSSHGAARGNEEDVIPESYDDAVKEIVETRVFKRPRFGGDKDAGKARNAKSLLLANAFKMQNNLMDSM
jgi:ATP-dependent RNA helicase DDX31/DBP7